MSEFKISNAFQVRRVAVAITASEGHHCLNSCPLAVEVPFYTALVWLFPS